LIYHKIFIPLGKIHTFDSQVEHLSAQRQ
jgi:hypothetical protein